MTCRLVLVITDLVAVLCILHLPLNAILQSRLSRRKWFLRMCFGFCVFVFVIHYLAYVMYFSILGLFLEFLYWFAFWPGIYLHDWHCMK